MMRKVVAAGLALVLLAVLVTLIVRGGQVSPADNTLRGSVLTIDAGPSPAPTPVLIPMTVYAVTNPNTMVIEVRHIITDTNLFHYEFTSTVPAGGTAEYHLRDIPSVPSPFLGALTLQSSHPFTSTVVGYDYVSSPAPTGTPTMQ